MMNSEAEIQINYLENSKAYGGLLLILNDNISIKSFRVIQGNGQILSVKSNISNGMSYMYEINNSGYLDEGQINPARNSIETPDIISKGNCSNIETIYTTISLSAFFYSLHAFSLINMPC